MNSITCPGCAVIKQRSVLIEKDFPLPRPPVTMKYLLSLSSTRYLLFITSQSFYSFIKIKRA